MVAEGYALGSQLTELGDHVTIRRANIPRMRVQVRERAGCYGLI